MVAAVQIGSPDLDRRGWAVFPGRRRTLLNCNPNCNLRLVLLGTSLMAVRCVPCAGPIFHDCPFADTGLLWVTALTWHLPVAPHLRLCRHPRVLWGCCRCWRAPGRRGGGWVTPVVLVMPGQRLVAARERVLGPDHPHTLRFRNTLSHEKGNLR